MAESKKKKKKKILTKKKVVKKKPLKKKVIKKASKKPTKKTVKKLTKKRTKKIVKKKITKTPQTRKIKRKISKSKKVSKKVAKLERHRRNPIMAPSPYPWESQAVFNPAAIDSHGRIHLFYRALGNDGISRLGYASSKDGIRFDTRLTYPVYVAENFNEAQKHWPFTSPARLTYNTSLYASGGGWGGCEDPRAVVIDGVVYLTFNMFNGWNSMRVAVTSIKETDLLNKKWIWQNFAFLSRLGDRQKNWVLFPEKINGKFVLFHNLDKGDPDRVHVTYLKNLDSTETPTPSEAPDPQMLPDHEVAWHYRTRSAASPPIKTKDGWLLLYHAMDKNDRWRYKVGAMLLDLKNPEKVLYRAQSPILEPDEWYENNWKPGIVYASGAVVRDGELFVYYGGGDKYIGVGTIKLSEFLASLKENRGIKLTKRKIPMK